MTRAIELSRGLVALVDDCDYARVMAAGPWCAVPQGHTFYAKAHAVNALGRRTTVHMHSLILGTRSVIDHRDRDGLNNQRDNLRVANQSRNIANSKRRVDNTSGYKGVHLDKRTGRWVARIVVARKSRHLGSFPTAAEAGRAYDAAAIKTWGEYARPNFPLQETA
jgi:hypothetical protein